MASRCQIEANRRNARKSTGPKTRAGKRRASRNAIRHGLHRQIEKSEILPLYQTIAADEGFTAQSLFTETRARVAYHLAEAEVRLADVIRIENKVWQDMGEEGVSRKSENPPSGKLTNEEWIDAIKNELDIDIDPNEVKGGYGRTFFSICKEMLTNKRNKSKSSLKPSLVRRYRNEAEANRQRLLQEWIESLGAEPCEFDEWFEPIYRDILAKRGS